MFNNKINAMALLLCLSMMLAMPLHASSVKSMSMSEVANNSALIFEGRVSASRVVQKPGSRAIHTLITFDVLDVLKGQYAKSTIELSFLGGSAGDISLYVADLHRPKVGDRGFYFVENPARTQVNPLYGWDQGHYLLKYQPELGRMAVTTRSGKAIYAIDRKIVAAAALSDGVPQGVSTSAIFVGNKPLTAADFKQQIREMLQ